MLIGHCRLEQDGAEHEGEDENPSLRWSTDASLERTRPHRSYDLPTYPVSLNGLKHYKPVGS